MHIAHELAATAMTTPGQMLDVRLQKSVASVMLASQHTDHQLFMHAQQHHGTSRVQVYLIHVNLVAGLFINFVT